MDQITREMTIRALREQLELCRVQSASLDNDVRRRAEMLDMIYGIGLLLEFMQRKQDLQ